MAKSKATDDDKLIGEVTSEDMNDGQPVFDAGEDVIQVVAVPTKEPEPVAIPEPTAVDKTAALIYLGPSLPGLRENTIFRSEPVWLADLWGKCPAIRSLMVATNKTAIIRKEMQVVGSREYLLRQEIKKFIKEG